MSLSPIHAAHFKCFMKTICSHGGSLNEKSGWGLWIINVCEKPLEAPQRKFISLPLYWDGSRNVRNNRKLNENVLWDSFQLEMFYLLKHYDFDSELFICSDFSMIVTNYQSQMSNGDHFLICCLVVIMVTINSHGVINKYVADRSIWSVTEVDRQNCAHRLVWKVKKPEMEREKDGEQWV